MWRAVPWLLLLGCGPVLLGEEVGQAAGTRGEAGAQAGMTAMEEPSFAGTRSSVRDAGTSPVAVAVRIKPVDCKCYELQAEGSGGVPPYEFQWEDGSLGARRTVCVEDNAVELSVVAFDAGASVSTHQNVHLDGAGDESCPEPPVPPPGLCLENPSLEGTPAPDFGLEPAFDAPPWTACTNPDRANMPRIGNDSISVTGSVPPPTDGVTYMALGEGDQASQELCGELQANVPVHLQLDAARIDLGGDLAPQTEKVFLEIWGGLSQDCSQSELLWATGALSAGWQTFCATLRPSSSMTQLTLRANADMTLPTPAFLIVDNLRPVDSCP